MAAFISGALQTFWPDKLAAWLARNCDRFLIILGVSHLVHLIGVISLAVTIGWTPFIKEISYIVLIFGNIIFLLTYAVALGAWRARCAGTGRWPIRHALRALPSTPSW